MSYANNRPPLCVLNDTSCLPLLDGLHCVHESETERRMRRSPVRAMKEIIEDAESLPVEERVVIIDSLLRTINPTPADVEAEWMKVAERRLAELRSGTVKAVPGSEVFAKVCNRFER